MSTLFQEPRRRKPIISFSWSVLTQVGVVVGYGLMLVGQVEQHNVFAQDKLPPTDSRLRPDQRHLENGEYDDANAEKLRLEQKQRRVS